MTIEPVRHGEITATSADPFEVLLEAWLSSNRRRSTNTRDAYRRDVADYAYWCADNGFDLLQVTWMHVQRWMEWLASDQDCSRKAYAASTIARKHSAVSSFYQWLVKAGLMASNPAADADRPRIDPDHSSTVTLNTVEAKAWWAAAGEPDRYFEQSMAEALAAFLIFLGPRVQEVCAADIKDLGHEQGHRTITLYTKGNQRNKRAIPAPLAHRIDAHLQRRAEHAGVDVADLTGPLLAHMDGRRLDRFQVRSFVRRVARRAGHPGWETITTHSMRHAFASLAREAGATLDEQQDALGHKDPRTTRRYNRHARKLSTDAAYKVAGLLGDE